MKLSRYERETNILFNEEESTATIFVSNNKLLKRMKQLMEDREGEVVQIFERENGEGALFCFPKSWVKINPPRILSEERKKQLTEQLRKARED